MIVILLLATGYLIRVFALYTLNMKCYWRVIPPPKLATTGVYSIVRHPLYLGGMFNVFGLGLLLSNWKIALLVTYILFHFFADRIDREEQMLIAIFGEEYLKYMKKTKALIPFIF